jgi:hypothetical protein
VERRNDFPELLKDLGVTHVVQMDGLTEGRMVVTPAIYTKIEELYNYGRNTSRNVNPA